MISHTEAAKQIRALLRMQFKGVKFSVKSERFTGGTSIDMKWVDGPTRATVEERVMSQFKVGAKYITFTRHHSVKFVTAIAASYCEEHNEEMPEVLENEADGSGYVDRTHPLSKAVMGLVATSEAEISSTEKTVTIIARAQFKADPRKVVYLNRSSDGKKQYHTYLFDGKATGCDCASRKPCYHMVQSEQHEAERQAYRTAALKEKERIESALVLHQAEVYAQAIEDQEGQASTSVARESDGYEQVWEELPEEERLRRYRDYELGLVGCKV